MNPTLEIAGLTTRWQPGQSGNPNGRPPRVIAGLREALGDEAACLTRDDLTEVFRVILEKPIGELAALCDDSKNRHVPAVVVVAAKQILRDTIEGKGTGLDTLLNRIYGRSVPATEPVPEQREIVIRFKDESERELAEETGDAVLMLARHPQVRP